MFDLIVRNAKLLDCEDLKDIGVANGVIQEIGKISSIGKEEIDCKGGMVLPPFVESHIHLDTVLTAGNPRWNQSGTLIEGINIWSERKSSLTVEDVRTRALSVIHEQLAYGCLYIRSHVDISDPKLTALKALLELKEQLAPFIHIQIVAFPQDGIISCSDNQQRLEEALRMGADAIGAIPHNEYTREDGVESLKLCFRLAEKYDRMINVFCDETDDEHSRYLEVVASLAIKTGLARKVSASHANAMALYPAPYVNRLINILKDSEINIITCPLVSSVMQSRYEEWPKGRGITLIKKLWKGGVNVSIGHDDILTPFYPLGTGNMLQAAHMAVHLAQMTGLEEINETINMITIRGAKALQIEAEYGLEIGKPASFILLPEKSIVDAIRYQSKCRYVISRGKILCESVPSHSNILLKKTSI
ncbi:cytosine deaminase [Cytobacillus firmus]|nr:cytosine deaminase [Cytobacillus firmus]